MNRFFLLFVCVSFLWGCAKNAPEESLKERVIETASLQTTSLPQAQEMVSLQEQSFLADEIPHNPFLTEEEEILPAQAKETVSLDNLAASAIFYSPEGKSRVIINGLILAAGDSIDNKRVARIQPETVILKDGATEYLVQLKE